jgi:phage gp46-like protein
MTNIDIKLIADELGIYDIGIDSDGDLTKDDSFDTSIIVSLFTDARADESEQSIPERRRGWWGDLFNDAPIGSKLWLLYQAKRTQPKLNSAKGYAQDSLSWLVSDKYAKSISITSNFIENGLNLDIIFERFNSQKENGTFNLWEGSAYVN